MSHTAPSSAFSTARRRTAALCLLLLALAVPSSAAEPGKLTAILLVARADLPDPNFADAVVLVMNNLGPAPVGLITNRPTKVAVSHVFPDLKQLAGVPDKLYFGGPVELESVWFLFRAPSAPVHAVRAFDDLYLSADRELLLKLFARAKPMENLKIFLGHAGWGPGQLEAEIAEGSWKLEHAERALIFDRKSEHPWPAPSAEGPKNST